MIRRQSAKLSYTGLIPVTTSRYVVPKQQQVDIITTTCIMVVLVVKFFNNLCSIIFRGTAGVVSRLSICVDGFETHTEYHIEAH